MSELAPTILSHLGRVHDLRQAYELDPDLAARVLAIQQHQHARFGRDYDMMLRNPRYERATRFFLDDLYGPGDFAVRDSEFGRIVPMMSRILPADLMHTVVQLAELHALTETLDHQMARALKAAVVDQRSYRAVWQAVGRRPDREHQLDLLIAIGNALDRHARTHWLAATLRLMRRPARVAGFTQLQSFLESGLSAFATMQGATEFLSVIATSERQLIADLSSIE